MFFDEKPLMIGVDVGGSHITAALINLDQQSVLEDYKIRTRVNSHGSVAEIMDVWVDLLKSIITKFPQREFHLRMAMPGPFDYERGISLITGMNKYEALYSLDIRKYLAEHLGLKPAHILFRNDAEAFLHGEVYGGAAKLHHKAIGITLGTGLGSAVSKDGITKDANLGVSPFKIGIAEDYISTRWFVKRYVELTGKEVRDTEALVQLYNEDPIVQSIFEEFCGNLSDFLAVFIGAEQPEVVVIGGNIAKNQALFLTKVEALLAHKNIYIPIKIATLWEDAALLGAAYYSPSEQALLQN